MTIDYTSGAGPEQLKRLFAEALDESAPDEESRSSSPLDLFLEKPGSQVGRYKLLSVLGEGGMGVVFLAQQERPIQRQVALKVIKPGMDSKRVITRFRTERQTLALLDHPNIARVIDAGATATGRPYFVMEYVQGLPITRYCDDHQCTLEERLGLFLEVCQAVQHAHQKGIIHRDLKPFNILVGVQDGRPVPKVIDFGVARAMGSSLAEHTLSTEQGQLVGTPVYMSPEQAKLIDLDVDTRTDVYSLGVLLYELLTGTPPFSEEQLREAGYLELQRIIRDQEPTRPSAKLSVLETSLANVAAQRQINPDALRKLVKGDLDWIVMKCLEKDRTRRYETAHSLAADLQHHLNHEPVVARPPSALYRLQKAWRRNKVVYAAIVAVAIALVAGTGISVWQASEARRNELEALRRAYNSDMSLAFRAMEDNLFGRVQESVRRHVPGPEEPDFRGWEWRYAWAQSQSDAVRVWDTPPDIDEVLAVKISPDERFMVSSEFHPGPTTSRHVRRLWDFQRKEELTNFHLPSGRARGLAFSHGGQYLALHCATDRNAHEIRIYDAATWESEITIVSESSVRNLSFSPDDKMLATAGIPFSVLWDWRNRKTIHQWTTVNGPTPLSLAFFPDGRRLAIGDANDVKIIDVVTGRVLHRQPARDEGTPALAVSPDGRCVAIGHGYEMGEIDLLDTVSGDLEPPLEGHSLWVSSLTFTHNGKNLISSSADNTIRIWDMSRRVTTRILRGHQSEVGVVALTADESRAVTGGKDKRILEWDLNAPLSPFRECRLDEPAQQVVFRPDGRSFYTVAPNGRIGLWDWDATTPHKRLSSSLELGHHTSILLSPEGKLLIAGTGNGQLCVLDADTLQMAVRRSASSEHIVPVELFDTGRLLVALESEKPFPPASDNYVSVWDTETWQLQSRTKTDQRVGYVHPREYCAVPPGSNLLLYPSGAELAWWDLRESKEQARRRVNSRRSGVIALSPTEPVLASAARGDFVSLWNWQTRRIVSTLPGYRSFHSVAFSPDGRRLATGSHGQGVIMLWDVSTRQEIARFGTSETVVERLQFSPDGDIICAVDQANHAYFWRAPSFEEIKTLAAERRTEEKAGSVEGFFGFTPRVSPNRED